jgi:cytoskeleton protein RodZ
MREISLRDIADRTKISRRYLEAMEADRFDLLPAPIFAKGFLREYARYVGLSPDDVVNHYLSVHYPEDVPGDPKEDTKVRSRPKPIDPGQPPVRRSWSYGLILAIAGLVLLVLVAVAAYLADQRHEEPVQGGQAPPIAAPPPAPFVQPAPVTPEPRAPLEVSLDFTKDCWVEAVIDGRNRFSELRVQGEALQLEAQTSIALTLGNAGAVDVQVNGYPLDLNRNDGDVVRDLLIDLNTIQALKAKKEGR